MKITEKQTIPLKKQRESMENLTTSESLTGKTARTYESKKQSQPNDFTKFLMEARKQASEEEVNKAFNWIKDMSSKEQLSKALLMVRDVKDRAKLVQKMLDRRQQIEKAKELAAINNMAPLFEKIKQKFLSTIQDTDLEYESQPSTIIKLVPPEEISPAFEESEEESQPIDGVNKNTMALNIFASHDIHLAEEDERQAQEMKEKRTKLLGYLQRDLPFKIEDKNKQNNNNSESQDGRRNSSFNNIQFKQQQQPRMYSNQAQQQQQQQSMAAKSKTEENTPQIPSYMKPLSRTSQSKRYKINEKSANSLHFKSTSSVSELQNENIKTFKFTRNISYHNQPTSYLFDFIQECEQKRMNITQQQALQNKQQRSLPYLDTEEYQNNGRFQPKKEYNDLQFFFPDSNSLRQSSANHNKRFYLTSKYQLQSINPALLQPKLNNVFPKTIPINRSFKKNC